ncbi:hypothetical protein CsSME_00004314 [Camellia sinensis var. sinensis]
MTSFAFPRFILRFGVSSKPSSTNARNHGFFIFSTNKRRYSTSKPLLSQQSSEAELLVVVGGGAAGIYGAIRAKTIAPNLNVVVIEKGKPLSKVKISGGGRCNVTNGHCSDNLNIILGVIRNLEALSSVCMVPRIPCPGFLILGWN